MLKPGTAAPTFTLPDQNGNQVSLADFAGKWLVFWWYPEANSSGCSVQAASLARSYARFTEQDVPVVGISFNTVSENDAFSCDKDLAYPLLSDADRAVGTAYDVVRDPGEPYPDKPRRITYVINPEGAIAYAEDANQVELNSYGEHVLDVVRKLRG